MRPRLEGKQKVPEKPRSGSLNFADFIGEKKLPLSRICNALPEKLRPKFNAVFGTRNKADLNVDNDIATVSYNSETGASFKFEFCCKPGEKVRIVDGSNYYKLNVDDIFTAHNNGPAPNRFHKPEVVTPASFDIMSMFGYATQHSRLATAAAVGTMALAINMLSESSLLSSVVHAVAFYALSSKVRDLHWHNLHSHRIFTRPVVYAKYAAAPEPAPAAPRK